MLNFFFVPRLLKLEWKKMLRYLLSKQKVVYLLYLFDYFLEPSQKRVHLFSTIHYRNEQTLLAYY